MKSLMAAPEKRFVDYLTPKFPAWIEGYHLTLLTMPWSAGLIGFGMLAAGDVRWLHASSAMLILQWFTDCFDGALGRYRDTGIPRWGFYMDHFLDFVFMCSVFIGWSFLFGGTDRTLFWFMSLGMGALMINAFLSFGATGDFKITYLRTGPTEMRLFFVAINTSVAFFGVGFIEKTLPYVFVVFILTICVVVYRTQKYIWKMDMAEKESRMQKTAGKHLRPVSGAGGQKSA
ncbi:MAG: CDP-alcohol phosphatidyltransferase family protein [Phycisphaerae bacterium]|nr:CDP-alcohol phosphatidyltransferase family protein [Phycisphaerae bacterium]